MITDKHDISALRDLGRQVAEIAALPDQQRTIKLWKKLNGLKPVRPMVMIDQIPWHEMNVDDELTLQCADKTARRTENNLRQRLYRWKHMRADYVVEPTIGVAPVNPAQMFQDERQRPTNTVIGRLPHVTRRSHSLRLYLCSTNCRAMASSSFVAST